MLWLGRVDPDIAGILAELNVPCVAPEPSISIEDPLNYVAIIVLFEQQIPSSLIKLEKGAFSITPAILVLSADPESAAAAMVGAGFDAFDLLRVPCRPEIARAKFRQLLQAHRARRQLEHNLKTLRVELETEIHVRMAKDLMRERHTRILNRLAGCSSFADGNMMAAAEEIARAADEAFGLLDKDKPSYLVGESLGSGVAAYLAGKYPGHIADLMLLSPYNRLTDVAQARMPLLPVRLMLIDRFPSTDYLKHYHGPVGIMVDGRDEVVPEKFGIRLFDSYAGPKRFWRFPDSGHIAIEEPLKFWSEVLDFWRANKPEQFRY